MITENGYLTSLIFIPQGENSLKISKRITACNMLKSSFHKRPPSLSLHLSSAISVHMFTQETSSPNWHTLCMENKHKEKARRVEKKSTKIITSLLSSLPTLEILLAGGNLKKSLATISAYDLSCRGSNIQMTTWYFRRKALWWIAKSHKFAIDLSSKQFRFRLLLVLASRLTLRCAKIFITKEALFRQAPSFSFWKMFLRPNLSSPAMLKGYETKIFCNQ